MTRLELAKKIERIEGGDKCLIPSPKLKNREARIMCYVEGYVVMRHKGCVPFLLGKKDVIDFLKNLIAQEEAKEAREEALREAASVCEYAAYDGAHPQDDMVELGCLRSRDRILALIEKGDG